MAKLHANLVSHLCFLTVLTVGGWDRLEARVDSSAVPARILVLFSYDASFSTFTDQVKGMRSILGPAGYHVDMEFMDSKRIPTDQGFAFFEDLIRFKKPLLPEYDLIMTVDDNALRFMLEAGKELFPETPVVFLGVNDLDFGRSMNQVPQITGVLEELSFQETVDLMHALFPDATRYHVISDGTATGRSDWREFQKVTLPEGVSCISHDLASMSFEELRLQVNDWQDADIALLISAYLDGKGRVHRFEDSVSMLTKECRVPVFHPYQHGVGAGLIGGKVVSHFEQGRTAAMLAKQVIEGTSIASLAVVEESPNRVMLDEQRVKLFGASLRNVPDDVIWVNRSPSFFRDNQRWIVATVLWTTLLIAVGAGFFLLWKRERYRRKQLQESEARANALFENPFVMMLVVDPRTGTIINANEAAVKYYGYSREELLGLPVAQLNTMSPEKLREVMTTVSQNQPGVFRFQHRLKSGEVRDVEEVSGPVQFDGVPYLFSIIKDNSEVMQHERRLELARQEAEKANQAKGDFLSMMSHEMRTPLNPIVGFASILLEEMEHEEHREQIQMMLESAEHLKRLIEEVLRFNKLNSGGYVLHEHRFSLVPLLKEWTQQAQLANPGNRLEFRGVALNDGDELELWGDPDAIGHIVTNLLSNACKYAENGNVVLGCRLKSEMQGRCCIEIEVEDDGVGIPKELQQEIFEPFRQVDNSIRNSINGVGLGLSICRSMADLLGAALNVESEPAWGRGSP